MRLLLPVALFLALVFSACGGKSPTGPGNTVQVSISPNPLFLNAGDTRTLTVSVSNNTTANCSATGGNLGQTGNQLTYVAGADGGTFAINCTAGNGSGTASVLISGPVTIDYEGPVPQYASQPNSGPSLLIGSIRSNGTYQSDVECDSVIGSVEPCTYIWLGGNHWMFTVQQVSPSDNAVKVLDFDRAKAEGISNATYCAVIRYLGVTVPVAGTDAAGCMDKFR